MKNTHKLIIGVTGGIGSGKSTVTDKFFELGIEHVDADIVAREVVAIGSFGLAEITSHFGLGILLSDGSLNRAKLREIIFSYPEEKKWLNQLLHPMINKEIIKRIGEISSSYGLLVVPLLLENNLQYLVDRILVIDVSEATQISRTTQRDQVSVEQAQTIINAQISRQDRLSQADDIIDNENEPLQLTQKIADLHKKYLALVAEI
ncbi:dephospho-CoA kinase [Vibrio sp. SS-MA-C1-2]|uniref:dephospho-CoA kinase n=1 Tax=Vibrio sp. SS-MA-C1-2 TaxID=2908646 RepID=UPI001EEC0413|nr:dephospho-CoA kinase [Vibrio sp. SS-MA-C1-2]UJF19620.1 dephospho-CoA kinase [Vibrio sp. SS-MA-C1-2]